MNSNQGLISRVDNLGIGNILHGLVYRCGSIGFFGSGLLGKELVVCSGGDSRDLFACMGHQGCSGSILDNVHKIDKLIDNKVLAVEVRNVLRECERLEVSNVRSNRNDRGGIVGCNDRDSIDIVLDISVRVSDIVDTSRYFVGSAIGSIGRGSVFRRIYRVLVRISRWVMGIGVEVG